MSWSVEVGGEVAQTVTFLKVRHPRGALTRVKIAKRPSRRARSPTPGSTIGRSRGLFASHAKRTWLSRTQKKHSRAAFVQSRNHRGAIPILCLTTAPALAESWCAWIALDQNAQTPIARSVQRAARTTGERKIFAQGRWSHYIRNSGRTRRAIC